MKSRALRTTLSALFVGLLAGAAYVVWSEESQTSAERATARAFDDRVRIAARALLDVKSAQPGYVAAGQGDEFWAAQVDTALSPLRESLAALGPQARSVEASQAVESAAATIDDFGQMDRRAREYARNGQRLLASDLIFSDGVERIDTALASLDRARNAELALRDANLREHRRMQALALAGAAALGCLIVFALVPVPRSTEAGPVRTETPAVEPVKAAAEPDLSLAFTPEPLPAVAASATPEPPAPAPPPEVDLQRVAAVCTELARVADTRTLPAALERAAAVLNASGIVIWIAEPDGRELAPILSHGYPAHLLARMGTIDRDASNVTAAAYRTGLVQTVRSDGSSNGALAAPLLAQGGAVGVMAAEVLDDGEQRESTRAVAAIVAAQLATLVAPPVPRAAGKSEVAGA
jgi:hypothetical protein